MSAPHAPVIARQTRQTPAGPGRRPGRVGLALAVLVGLAACAHVPELDARIPDAVQKAPYPDLLPLDMVLAPLPAPQEAAAGLETALAGRRDSLQARARRLQTPVVDDENRARMAAGVSR